MPWPPPRSAARAVVAVALLVAAAAISLRPAAATVGTPSLRGSALDQPLSGDDVVLAARDANKAGDRAKLAALAVAAPLTDHPLRAWVEYWALQARLRSGDSAASAAGPAAVASDAEVKAFLARYPDTYLADRLRADWLLTLGARGDLAAFEQERRALIWNHDEPQLRCYALLARYGRTASAGNADGQAIGAGGSADRSSGPVNDELVREARNVLALTKEGGADGCDSLAAALITDGKLTVADHARRLVEQNQLTAARRWAAQLPGFVPTVLDKPAAWLTANARSLAKAPRALVMVALARLARDEPEQAATYAASIDTALTAEQRALVWGRIGHMAAVKLLPEAPSWFRRGGAGVGGLEAARNDEVREWHVRAALRGDASAGKSADAPDWPSVRSVIERMPADQQRDPAWIYWRGRADAALGKLEPAQSALRSIASGFGFYEQLAADELGLPSAVPARALPPGDEEVNAFAANAGLARALKLLDLGLRLEGSREWNWQIRAANNGTGMSDRQLLALAEYARSRGALDRMISTSERTRTEFDFAQRFPAPHRAQMQRFAQPLGLDETWVFGLIRQESRFAADARSSVGAHGLMQLMPTTAKYVARKIGLTDYQPDRLGEPELNIQLGTAYLKMVLDDLDGQPMLASAAYNAGPKRPRKWRASLLRPIEGAIFAETIPLNETRDYVKKVMANAVTYARLFNIEAPTLKRRLGVIAPRPAGTTDVP